MPVPVDGSTDGPERALDWHKADDKLHRRNEQAGAMARATCRVIGLFKGDLSPWMVICLARRFSWHACAR